MWGTKDCLQIIKANFNNAKTSLYLGTPNPSTKAVCRKLISPR